MYVLDEGSAYKNWRQRFIGTVLSGYGTVVAFNLYMMIAEVVSGSGMLNFFESDFLNRAVELIFLLVGAMMLKNISKTISGIIGADDAMEQGEGIGKQITDKAKKVGKTAVGVGVGAATLAVGGAAMLGSAGAGIASKVAAWKGGKNADKLDKANEGLSEKQKAVRSRSTNVQKMMDKKQNDLAQKIYKKDFSELKEDQQKEIMENLGKNKAYNRYAEMKANLDNEAEDLGSQMAANTAEKEKELTRGRTAHVIAARTAKLGGANFKGMFANSSVGKSFNQITGNAIKATGGKGINQWDGEITQYSDTEGDIFKEYNKANEATKEKLYNKYVLGARGTNFARSNIAPQTREEAQKEYENIMMAGQESGAQEQGLRINQRDIADGIIRGFREGAFASAKDLDQMRDNAKEHERLTGSNAMTLQVAKLEGINAQFQRGEISAADAERKARKVEHDMHLDQKVDTKVEAEIKKDGGDFQKLKDAIKAGNHEAMDKALKSLQEKLGKEGVQIKDIEQITKEIQKLATEEKANEKKLTKIMSQIGKLTGK